MSGRTEVLPHVRQVMRGVRTWRRTLVLRATVSARRRFCCRSTPIGCRPAVSRLAEFHEEFDEWRCVDRCVMNPDDSAVERPERAECISRLAARPGPEPLDERVARHRHGRSIRRIERVEPDREVPRRIAWRRPFRLLRQGKRGHAELDGNEGGWNRDSHRVTPRDVESVEGRPTAPTADFHVRG